MSLLTTFGILFETDAEKAKRELDDVDKSLSDVEGSADGATDSVDDLGAAADDSANSFFDLSEGLGSVAAGLVVVTGLFAGMTAQALVTDDIGKFTETLGLSIEDTIAWGEAVIRSGGSADGFRSTLQGLTTQLTEIELTGGGAISETFARLGVDAIDSSGKVKDAFSILPELADSFQNLSKADSFAFGQKLGLDQGTILLLQQGRVAVAELVGKQKELGVATKEDYQAAALFNDEMSDSKQVFSNLFTTAGTTILPLLTMMLKGFRSIVGWVKENQTFVTGFFIAVAGVITTLYLPAMISAATATIAFLSPFLLIGAAVAAVGVSFALLYEDVKAYLGGQESFIGDLAKKYEWFGDIVNGVIDGIKDSFAILSQLFDDFMDSIPDISGKISSSFGDVKSFFGFDDDELSANLDKAIKITSSIDSNPLNGQTSASIVNSQKSSSRVNNVTVGSTTVNTQATDAAGVASAVGDNLNNQILMAIGQFDDAEAY